MELIKKIIPLIINTRPSNDLGSAMYLSINNTEVLIDLLECEADEGKIDSALSDLIDKYSEIIAYYAIETNGNKTVTYYQGHTIAYEF